MSNYPVFIKLNGRSGKSILVNLHNTFSVHAKDSCTVITSVSGNAEVFLSDTVEEVHEKIKEAHAQYSPPPQKDPPESRFAAIAGD